MRRVAAALAVEVHRLGIVGANPFRVSVNFLREGYTGAEVGCPGELCQFQRLHFGIRRVFMPAA